MKIITFEDTVSAYFYSPFMVPDLIVIICVFVFIAIDEPIIAKYFELFRMLHFNDTLYPIYLCVDRFAPGRKRIS